MEAIAVEGLNVPAVISKFGEADTSILRLGVDVVFVCYTRETVSIPQFVESDELA